VLLAALRSTTCARCGGARAAAFLAQRRCFHESDAARCPMGLQRECEHADAAAWCDAVPDGAACALPTATVTLGRRRVHFTHANERCV
jgi:hypothetical protein